MQTITNFFVALFNAGVSKATDEEDQRKIRYLNQGLIFGTIMFIPNVIFEAIIGFVPATLLNLCFILLTFVCLFINRQGKYNIARHFTFIGLNLILLTANFTEGTQTGNYLIFSSLILIFPILIKVKDDTNEIAFHFLFTITCLTISIAFGPKVGYLKGLDETDAALMFKGSFVVSFGLNSILAYIIYSITKERETELIKAKELAEESAKIKLQFLSNMSHELRTPLNGIIGSTNLLKLEKDISQQKEQLDLLDYSSKHMLHLVNDVLDFSKIESGKIELEYRNFNLKTFVENIYNSFVPQFEQKKLYFELLHHDANLNYNICTDGMRLGQILNNLLSNALKFTHQGGVSFGISTTPLSNNTIQVKFDIIDTGIGIKKQNLNNIFESFVQGDLDTTRKYGGTGLGLTISKKLVEVFDATLQVESFPEKGSHFFFSPTFNLTNELIEKSNEDVVELKRLDGMKILLAEDNKINMLIARKFLLKWGANITEASNGLEAIEHCKHASFDMLLLDLEMPEADGYTALNEIRKIYPTIPAIAFTAAVFENIHAVLLQKGFNDFIHKPFSPQVLNEKIFRQMQLLAKSTQQSV